MKTIQALTIVAAALFLAGCPKRQGVTRLLYTPTPPPAARPSTSAQAGVLVIEAPASPPPAQPAPVHQEAMDSNPVQAPIHRHHPARAGAPESAGHGTMDAGTGAGAVEPPAASPPQLAPASSAQQQVELENRIGALKSAIQQRIDRLSHRRLLSADHKALQDARLFLSQADQAAQQGDMQQSLNLAQKADLLIAAVEKRY